MSCFLSSMLCVPCFLFYFERSGVSMLSVFSFSFPCGIVVFCVSCVSPGVSTSLLSLLCISVLCVGSSVSLVPRQVRSQSSAPVQVHVPLVIVLIVSLGLSLVFTFISCCNKLMCSHKLRIKNTSEPALICGLHPFALTSWAQWRRWTHVVCQRRRKLVGSGVLCLHLNISVLSSEQGTLHQRRENMMERENATNIWMIWHPPPP